MFTPHRMHLTHIAHSVVGVPVCVTHSSELCKNGRTDRDAVRGTGNPVLARGLHLVAPSGEYD